MTGFAGREFYVAALHIGARSPEEAAEVVSRIDRLFTVADPDAPFVVVDRLARVDPAGVYSPVPPERPRCAAMVKDGSRRCRNAPLAGGAFCLSHDPERSQELRAQLDAHRPRRSLS